MPELVSELGIVFAGMISARWRNLHPAFTSRDKAFAVFDSYLKLLTTGYIYHKPVSDMKKEPVA